jgi:hypothetical protein
VHSQANILSEELLIQLQLVGTPDTYEFFIEPLIICACAIFTFNKYLFAKNRKKSIFASRVLHEPVLANRSIFSNTEVNTHEQGEARVASITCGKRVLVYVCMGLSATFRDPIWVSSDQILVIVVSIS